MKKYFVYFTYRKILPHSQERTNPMLTFEIITLDNTLASPSPTITVAGVLISLRDLGYTEDVTVIHMNPL